LKKFKTKRPSALIDFDELPSSYNSTKITLLTQSPHCLYAYWEISKASYSKIKKQLGRYFKDVNFFLRVYELDSKDFPKSKINSAFDITITSTQRKHYINLSTNNTKYRVDIGYKIKNGFFQKIARSNSVSSQREGYANNQDLQWLSVNDNNPKDITILSKDTKNYYDNIFKKYSKTNKFSLDGNQTPLSREEIWSYYANLSPLLRKIKLKNMGTEIRKKYGDKICDALRERTSSSSSNQIPITTKELKKFFSGSSAELIKSSIAKELKGIGASEIFSNEKKRNFFFELNTELIVYGRTEPNASVKYLDNKIEVREDGTFSLRFALPDGKIPLNFTAQSFDKLKQKNINTAAERFQTISVPAS